MGSSNSLHFKEFPKKLNSFCTGCLCIVSPDSQLPALMPSLHPGQDGSLGREGEGAPGAPAVLGWASASPRSGLLRESRVPRPGKGGLMLQMRALAVFPVPARSFFVIRGWFLASLLKHGPVFQGLFSHPLYMKISGCERTSLLREISGTLPSLSYQLRKRKLL